MIDYARTLTGEVCCIDRPDGTRIHTVRGGRGAPTVVLAHGYGVDLREWNVVVDQLDDLGWVAFDLRGHGQSTIGADGVASAAMAKDIRAVLETHDVSDAVLVGHSTGGFLSLKFLVDHPDSVSERLRGCLLVATFAGDVNRSNLQNRIQIPLIRTGVLQRMLRLPLVARAFVRSLGGDDFNPAWIEPFVDAFLANDHRALVPLLRSLVAENGYPRLPEIRLPCTIVVGTKDHTTPSFHADELHAGLTGSKLVRLDGKGHLLNWEAPEVLVRELRDLLQ